MKIQSRYDIDYIKNIIFIIKSINKKIERKRKILLNRKFNNALGIKYTTSYLVEGANKVFISFMRNLIV